MSEPFDETCSLCGTPVRVVGSVTMSYESAYAETVAKLAAAEKEIERLNSIEKKEQFITWSDMKDELENAMSEIKQLQDLVMQLDRENQLLDAENERLLERNRELTQEK